MHFTRCAVAHSLSLCLSCLSLFSQDPTDPQTEAELDIQMVAGVNTGATNWFWLEKGQGWLYQFVQHFAVTEDVPQVSSISYGWWESDQVFTHTYTRRGR